MKIQINPSLYIKHISQEKGYGVFTKAPIFKDSIIETCYLIQTGSPDIYHVGPTLMDYVFNYPKGLDIGRGASHVLPTGFGCVYNHDEKNNARWENSATINCFDFIAERDIKAGEEICTYYGSHYWPEKLERDEIIKNGK
jgi:SET domain-containing protein|tara:strand:- start:1122 stop:1541 length:420 start_codon:yes stop_codon:yes gene_type:complete